MNKDDTLALWKRGQNEWNKWARELLEEQKLLQKEGQWQHSAESWLQRAAADFDDGEFDESASWDGFEFPGSASFHRSRFTRANFKRAKFHSLANFGESSFSRDAEFWWTTFSKGADFSESKFRRNVSFKHCSFDEHTEFIEVIFFGPVEFSEVKFLRLVDFERSIFRNSADFSKVSFPAETSFEAIRSEVSFSIAGATFLGVPDFVDATFREAPRLDNARIPQCGWRGADREVIAYYRKLRAMAIAGHDYEREREFFVNELRARRGNADRFWTARYLAALMYGALSDYGRSILRPAALWFVSTCFCWGAYYWQHLTDRPPPSGPIGMLV